MVGQTEVGQHNIHTVVGKEHTGSGSHGTGRVCPVTFLSKPCLEQHGEGRVVFYNEYMWHLQCKITFF